MVSGDKKSCSIHGSNCDGGCVDPNVDNGMMTKVWGPAGWLFLHCVSFGYPYAINVNNPEHKTKKEDYKIFFEKAGNVLPCRYCRDSYKEFIKEIPIDNYLNTRNDLCKWLYLIHNKVNHKLGVPDCDIPKFEEVQGLYESFRAKCKKTTEEERLMNANKGCVAPADGTPKKCMINVVECSKGDVTRREIVQDNSINMKLILLVLFVLIIIFVCRKKISKLLKRK
jgi:hypothetical protein